MYRHFYNGAARLLFSHAATHPKCELEESLPWLIKAWDLVEGHPPGWAVFDPHRTGKDLPPMLRDFVLERLGLQR